MSAVVCVVTGATVQQAQWMPLVMARARRAIGVHVKHTILQAAHVTRHEPVMGAGAVPPASAAPWVCSRARAGRPVPPRGRRWACTARSTWGNCGGQGP